MPLLPLPQWTVTCPDGRNATLNGITASVLIANSPTATINPLKPTPILTEQKCASNSRLAGSLHRAIGKRPGTLDL